MEHLSTEADITLSAAHYTGLHPVLISSDCTKYVPSEKKHLRWVSS
jgi:hypothetical protein